MILLQSREGTKFVWSVILAPVEVNRGALLSMQIAYALIEEQQGMTWAPDNYISFVGLLAHEHYCGTHCSSRLRSLLEII